ncbi:hypothetical protein H0H81_002430 [Sphagnurus paluster]|uniref:Uncharacterized protein n=1 Tax=Sphagnurus paluster TaxID=117069 RepID=A0A9P7GGQ3_9AGAR|nr:hypothetical protein H0H81_002430 [Sphagnurus paluster]
MAELSGESTPPETRLEQGKRVMQKALELCTLYPGDLLIPASTLLVKIDEKTGTLTALIDLERSPISPVWECATIPRWPEDPEGEEGGYEGGPAAPRVPLRALFIDTFAAHSHSTEARGEEWRNAYETGRPFRAFTSRLSFHWVEIWATDALELWVDRRVEWARANPGVGYPEEGCLEQSSCL